MITAAEFRAWARQAKPRTSVIYYTGDISHDRLIPSREKRRVCALAATVLGASEMGLVDLTQRKIEDGIYEYRAIKRRMA